MPDTRGSRGGQQTRLKPSRVPWLELDDQRADLHQPACDAWVGRGQEEWKGACEAHEQEIGQRAVDSEHGADLSWRFALVSMSICYQIYQLLPEVP